MGQGLSGFKGFKCLYLIAAAERSLSYEPLVARQASSIDGAGDSFGLARSSWESWVGSGPNPDLYSST
jgi:hypothetical protein